jgi:para-aminobenzoate synthetase/4-amino-4-deoxychorismate lyase
VALLDDCSASSASPQSRLYAAHAGTLRAESAAELDALFAGMQEALGRGLHAVALFDYEFGEQLKRVSEERKGKASILLFGECKLLSDDEVTQWLEQRDKQEQFSAGNASYRPSGVAGARSSISRADFEREIGRIKDYIEAGDIYQLNYTFHFHFDAYGTPSGLYRRLRERQPVPYGAFIMLPDGDAVLSLSPELFIRNHGGNLTAQPMKGTAAVSGNAALDETTARALAADEKNRAENVMIVDLLRNDLGRVAETGSVAVPALFEVNRHGGVLQMTSTVTATLRHDASLADIFTSLFPCGSVTGAPKHRAMQIISDMEPGDRGIYTGAIGWFEPAPAQRMPDFCLSVPIRTLVLAPGDDGGVRPGVLGIGSGIVFDSTAESEYEECLLKARFLTELPHEFELFETMHATRKEGVRYLDRHLLRLGRSASYFGLPFDSDSVEIQVKSECERLEGPHSYRMKLSLDVFGKTSIQTHHVEPLTEPVSLLLSSVSVRANDLFLRHKTSVRNHYDEAWKTAEQQGAFDVLFLNEYGDITEGARSSVMIRLGGKWRTPKLACGLLPGVMRAVMMAASDIDISEGVITVDELYSADEIAICNALRGVLRARLAQE